MFKEICFATFRVMFFVMCSIITVTSVAILGNVTMMTDYILHKPHKE